MTTRSRAWLSLLACAAAGVALAVLSPDSYQQDAGHHYLFARFAWTHRELLVGVWSRPLFTFLYSLPAQFGYPAAKLFTLAICLATAFHSYRLAEQLKLERAWLAAPLLFLQPVFFLISADTMTEPVFALLFVLALRLHTAGRIYAGMAVASLMILARPEGLFLGALWGLWVIFDRRVSPSFWRRAIRTWPLLGGIVIWWIAAFVITGDPLFIKHDWPSNWAATSATYGVGPLWTYVLRLPEIAGPLLMVPFVLGLAWLVARRRLPTVTSSVVMLFVLHSLMRAAGWFGSAGYARYFVCVSPAIAIVTLAGWNEIAERLSRARQAVRRGVAAVTLVLSAIVCVVYADITGVFGRDARAVTEMHAWFVAHPRPVSRLAWSQAYMCILFDRDPWEKPAFSTDKAANIELLRTSPAGTLVFWDRETGPAWYGLTPADIESAGYEPLRSQSYLLDGWLGEARWLPRFPARGQDMHLFYKKP